MQRSLFRFLGNTRANTGIIFALSSVVVVGAAGVAVDYSQAVSAQSELQAIVDAATLAAASTVPSKNLTRQKAFKQFFETNDDGAITVHGYSLSEGKSALEGNATAKVETTLSKVLGFESLTVQANAVVGLASSAAVDVALVLDVSSSMIEEDRFEPMKLAAQAFVNQLTSAGGNWRISVVPFSSRINPGLQNTAWLASWNGAPAVPERWTNPSASYGSSFKRVNWIDGVNYAMANSKNYYWMGCVEPRLDVAMKLNQKAKLAQTDAAPSAEKFYAQDANSQSGKSFCPPPVTPLTSNKGTVTAAISNLTSQGSTRLDAGMLGGWYAVSPNWAASWSATPASTASDKIVVFMTDGQMNTNDDPSEKHYDWVCDGQTKCDAYAEKQFSQSCLDMKKSGIRIYTVSYDKDAEKDLLKSCASGSEFFFEASSSDSKKNYIGVIYEQIAKTIVSQSLYLSQ